MQDENTTQPTATDAGAIAGEPDLNLGSNPAVQQPDPTSGTSDAVDSPIVSPLTEDVADSSSADTPPAVEEPSPAIQPAAGGQSDELESIKTSALQELGPIVSELDQPPEEKYRTLMMLIQSSDDQTLIKAAYDAAHGIEDKKAKAEALLNIVNEINYFTGKGVEKPEA